MSTPNSSNGEPVKPPKISHVENPILPEMDIMSEGFLMFFTFEDEPPAIPEPDDFRENVQSRFEDALSPLADLMIEAYRGDKEAAKCLVEVARVTCEKIEEMERFIPGIFDGIERKAINWPMAVGPGPANFRHVKQRLERLELGTQAPFRIAAKGKHPDYFAKNPYRLLIRLFRYIDEVRQVRKGHEGHRLPEEFPKWLHQLIDLTDLNKQTAQAWFEVMWGILMHATDGKPETRKELWELGQAREYDSEDQGHINPPKGTRTAKIRNGIKTRLKRDFFLMLNTDSQGI